MPRLDILNFINFFNKESAAPEPLNGLTAEQAAKKVRNSCKEKALNFEDWSRGILENCAIPGDHPYRTLLVKRHIPEGDPLWALGAIAYGTESPWIILRRICWDDGTEDYPEQMDRDWMLKQTKSL